MMTDERRRLEKLVNRLESGQYVNGIAVETMRELFAELHRLEQENRTLKAEIEQNGQLFIDGKALLLKREEQVTRLEQALEKLRKECERLDADGDKWMNRAAVAEQRLDDLQK